MDFSWTKEQEELRRDVAAFAAELNEGVIDADRASEFSLQKWLRCAEFGIQGLGLPREYGGRALSPLTAARAMEGFGYGCCDNGLTLGLNAQMWTVQQSILDFGTPAQRDRWLPQLAKGEALGAYAMTEPEAGSDAYSLQMTATACDGGYVLTGHKRYCTLAPVADLGIVFAKTDPSAGSWGLSAFLVELDREGVRRGPTVEKMGLRTVPMSELFLDDCFVPAEDRLGDEGQGAVISNNSLEWERSCMLASLLGATERQLESALGFAKKRQQFGQPIGRFQSVANRIADGKLHLESARMLVYRVAWLKERNKPAALESALAKLQVTECLAATGLDNILIHGAHGYLTENNIERDLRDAVGSLIYGGTSDIQRANVARLLGL